MSSGAPDWWIQGIIPMRFVNLSDTPGDYIGRAGLVPEVNAGEDALEWSAAKIDDHKARHKSGGDDEIDVSGLTPKLHEATHRNGGTDVLLHNNMALNPADHHAVYLNSDARGAINNIFGSDGKADANIDLDGYELQSGSARVGPQESTAFNDLVQNAYWTGSQWKLIANGYAVRIMLTDGDGSIRMYTAATGTAEDVITWNLRFMLDVDGNITQVASFNGVDLSAPITVAPGGMVPSDDTDGWTCSTVELLAKVATGAGHFFAQLQLPSGATVSELKFYCYRDLGATSGQLWLYRTDMLGTTVNMAYCLADWTTGWDVKIDSSINSPVVDNTTYAYYLHLVLTPNTADNRVRFGGARISFA